MKKAFPGKQVTIILSIVFSVVVYLFLDLGAGNEKAEIVAAAALLMALLWITESIPLAATSLLPLVVFPLTGAVSAKSISQAYVNSTIFLFVGGFIIAVAMEKWKLHKRIAVNIIYLLGNSPGKIILGFMIASAFISMWISNTATAVMLLPIGLSVIKKVEEENQNKNVKNFSITLMLAIAYSCSIGGLATPIGTPPNLVFQRVFKINFPNYEQITFAGWMALVLPITIILLAFVWFLLNKIIYRTPSEINIDRQIIKKEKLELGKLKSGEKSVLFVFIATSLLWIFRSDINTGLFVIPGWSNLMPASDFIDDGTVAITTALLLFMIPVKNSNGGTGFVLESDAINKIPWDIVLLFGGGFALAYGFVDSGLSELIGKQFVSLKELNPFYLILSICLIVTFLTELTSNTATAQILLPILASLSLELNINPMLLMAPATFSASCAFMLPVATPPNAIVFGSRKLRIKKMALPGVIINFTGAAVITIIVMMNFL
ncbi:putative Na(+)-dicarboxylate cotransporter (solute carrier family 13 protein) [Melioribacter roseus P3M-2]|uniref:Putative Na(+)-dicarboxylate cotransporter (Solute carrier family 13 protein) n=1 Tax=Melioribacter roseus (strain DSM 23840 / JCM 17771 / VKM B-2668 / P3M-2) TaxID=1191523 RepID=I6ZSE3_MELRP|nr:SLC13 family permease [Melioribacter roseus]AFN74939.1 putative Na(+)-dicarboxylate cotransporter (solute carrier family 13 protein) [Melioribacter roseus P3M-2]